MFEQIEQLKRQYTDKLVMVDPNRPELARFHGQTGQVKTVNMSGRALVQFDANNNIGWYDIDPSFLTVIDQPLPPREKAAEAAPKKTAPAPKPKQEKIGAAESMQPGGAPLAKDLPAAKPGKKSTADILAAARANKPGAKAGEPAAAAKPAAPKATDAKPAGGKMSTADILAAARAAKQAHPPEEQPAPVAENSTAEAEVEQQEHAQEAPVAARSAKPAPGGPLPKTTAERIAWCRQMDSK